MKNTTPIFIAIFLGICCLSSSSCTSLFEKMYGVNNVKDLDTSFIARFVREDTLLNHYPEYYLDSGFIVKQDKVFGESQTRHNLLQPIQALYFDSTGTLISWHINCNAGGFPNLHWNRHHVFQSFPPSSQTDLSAKIEFFDYINFLKPLNGSPVVENKPVAKYTIVVLWNIQLYKQSRRLIEYVLNNIKEHNQNKNVRILFVNTDLMYLGIQE